MPRKAKAATAAKKAVNKTAARRRVTFKLQAKPGSVVTVAGSFNNWDAGANPLKDKDGSGAFAAIILLAPGSHEYKFVVDGVWCVDPGCAEWVQNDLGTLNSVLRV